MDIFANKCFHHCSNWNTSSEWYFVHNSSSSFDAAVSKQMKIFTLIQMFIKSFFWMNENELFLTLDSTFNFIRSSQVSQLLTLLTAGNCVSVSCACFVYKYKQPDCRLVFRLCKLSKLVKIMILWSWLVEINLIGFFQVK